MDADISSTVFVDLWNQIGKGKGIQHLAVANHGFVSNLFTDLKLERVVFIKAPISDGKLKPRLKASKVHGSMRHGPHRSIDFTCCDVTPFDEQFSFNVRLASVGDIKHGEFGEAAGAPRLVISIPTHGVNNGVIPVNGPRTHSGNDDELVAIKHHGHRRTRQRNVGRSLKFPKLRHAENMEVGSLDVVDVIAVGFQEISLVDTGFLIVGAREVFTLDAWWCCGSGLCAVTAFGNGSIRQRNIASFRQPNAVEIGV